MLTLRGVSYRYPGVPRDCLHGIDLDLAEGTVTGLVGAAESGKTTLCLVTGGLAPRVIGGRLVGDMSLDGADVSSWPMYRLAEHVVTGLQDPGGQLSLIADTVFEEVAFGPANLGLPRAEIFERCHEALARVGIEDLRDRDPATLSGGQQQLVVMAGLLAMTPRYLVLDEPVAHLDARGAQRVLEAITAIAAAGTAVLMAEQRTDALLDVCDSVAVLAGGNLVLQGPPGEVLADPTVAAFGIEEPYQHRLRRRLLAAGLELGLLEGST